MNREMNRQTNNAILQKRMASPLKVEWYYKSVAGELSVQGGLLLRGSYSCIVIPPALRKDILVKIHTGHLGGITKCQEGATQSAWWPRIRRNKHRRGAEMSCV